MVSYISKKATFLVISDHEEFMSELMLKLPKRGFRNNLSGSNECSVFTRNQVDIHVYTDYRLAKEAISDGIPDLGTVFLDCGDAHTNPHAYEISHLTFEHSNWPPVYIVGKQISLFYRKLHKDFDILDSQLVMSLRGASWVATTLESNACAFDVARATETMKQTVAHL